MSPVSSIFHRLPLAATAAVLAVSVFTACSPEVGSKEWCEDLKAKPKGEWTANEAGSFAKHCVF
ncbi:MAG: DUF3012 domain-containing protein [Rhodospirillales bacterium]